MTARPHQLGPIRAALSDAAEIRILHEVGRSFRFVALLEWTVFLLSVLVVLPIWLFFLVRNAFDGGSSGDFGGSEGGPHETARPATTTPAPRLRRRLSPAPPHEEHSRFFHYRHRLSIVVLDARGEVRAQLQLRRARQKDADPIIAIVLEEARQSGVPVIEEVRSESFQDEVRWAVDASLLRRPHASREECIEDLEAAGFTIEQQGDETILRRRDAPPSLDWLKDAVVTTLMLSAWIALLLFLLSLVITPFGAVLVAIAGLPLLLGALLLGPAYRSTTRSPSLAQTILRLGSDYELSCSPSRVAYRRRIGLRWRRRTLELDSLVAVGDGLALSYGKRAHWLPSRVRLVGVERTVCLDETFTGGRESLVADLIVHATAGVHAETCAA